MENLLLLSDAATDRVTIRDAYADMKAKKVNSDAMAALQRLLNVSTYEGDNAMRAVTEWDEEERKQEAEASRARAGAKEIAYVGMSARVKAANERAAAMRAAMHISPPWLPSFYTVKSQNNRHTSGGNKKTKFNKKYKKK